MALATARAIAVVAMAAAAIAGGLGGLHRAHSPAFDWIQRAIPRQPQSLPVVIVNIDEPSLAAFGQWPWPRTLTARLIKVIKAMDPVAIGLDIVMPESDRLSPSTLLALHPEVKPEVLAAVSKWTPNDGLLADAFAIGEVPVVAGNAGLAGDEGGVPAPVLTPYRVMPEVSLKRVPRYAHILRNVPALGAAAAGHGLLNAIVDPDGITRRLPLAARVGDALYPSMATELLRVAQGEASFTVDGGARGVERILIGTLPIPTGPDAAVTVRFSLSDARRYLSAQDVLEGRVAASAMKNKLVLIGVTALGLTDAPPTPVSARMNGVEVQAQLLENLLDGSQLARPAYAQSAELAAGIGGGLLLTAAVPALGAGLGLVSLLACAGFLIAFSAWSLAELGLLFDPVPPLTYLGVAYLALSAALLWRSEQARRGLQQALAEERVRRARVDGELDAARDIQRGILPDAKTFALPPGCSLDAFLEAAAEVGGDLYDIVWLDERRLFLVLGDVSGKGVPASLFMAVSKTLCKSTALRARIGVEEILTLANREISRENPTLLFVTAIAVIVDVRNGEFEFASAGHDAPFVVRPGHVPRRLGGPGGPPLCALDDFDYPRSEARLTPGETLVLITDGVTEAMNSQGELFGAERVAQSLARVPVGEAAAAISERLRRDLAAFTRGAPPSDDVAIVAFQLGPDEVPSPRPGREAPLPEASEVP